MTAFVVEVNNRVVASALQKAINIMPQNIDFAVQRAADETAQKLYNSAPRGADNQLALTSREPRQEALMEWRVGPAVNYAQFVHDGTSGGGFVPFAVLFEWIKRKRIQPRDPEMSLRDLTWVIQKKILMRGSPAQPFVKTVFDSGFPAQRLNELVAKAAAQTVIEAGL